MKFQVLEDILIEYFFLISEKFRFILLFIHLFMIVKSRNKKKFIVLSAQRSERQKILPLHFFSIFVCRIIRLRQTIKKKNWRGCVFILKQKYYYIILLQMFVLCFYKVKIFSGCSLVENEI